uniref:Uncharacterized protein n=1 Tax=Oryza glumipatula TaxID=40148 RepID=A0A0D9YKP5_9ORYZ
MSRRQARARAAVRSESSARSALTESSAAVELAMTLSTTPVVPTTFPGTGHSIFDISYATPAHHPPAAAAASASFSSAATASGLLSPPSPPASSFPASSALSTTVANASCYSCSCPFLFSAAPSPLDFEAAPARWPRQPAAAERERDREIAGGRGWRRKRAMRRRAAEGVVVVVVGVVAMARRGGRGNWRRWSGRGIGRSREGKGGEGSARCGDGGDEEAGGGEGGGGGGRRGRHGFPV